MSLTKEAVLDRMKDLDVVLLNVLSVEAYEKIHITGSHCLAFGDNIRSFAMAVEKKYGKGKFFITYSADKSDSLGLNAARVLQGKGLKAEDYSGGTQEWQKAGFPTEGTGVKPPILKK